jgi:hypothetical protein
VIPHREVKVLYSFTAERDRLRANPGGARLQILRPDIGHQCIKRVTEELLAEGSPELAEA